MMDTCCERQGGFRAMPQVKSNSLPFEYAKSVGDSTPYLQPDIIVACFVSVKRVQTAGTSIP
jgi:hypothetical protein